MTLPARMGGSWRKRALCPLAVVAAMGGCRARSGTIDAAAPPASPPASDAERAAAGGAAGAAGIPELDEDSDDSSVVVRLAKPGIAPRRVLRHRFVVGAEQQLTMRTATRLGGENDSPPTVTEQLVALRVESTAAGGAALVTFALAPAPAVGERDQSDATESAFAAADARLTQAVVTPRGIVREEQPSTSPLGAIAAVGLGDLVEPLPREAVGLGAQWTVKRQRPEAGTLVESVTVYEITRIDSDRVQVRLVRRDRALSEPESPLVTGPVAPPPVTDVHGQVVIVLGQPCSRGWFELDGLVEVPLAPTPIRLSARVDLSAG